MRGKPCAIYLGGIRVNCTLWDAESLSQNRVVSGQRASDAETLSQGRIMSDPAASDAPLAMTKCPGPAPYGWISMVRGYAKPRPAPHEALVPLGAEHHAMMRGLYGLFAGRFPGMLTREDPEEWAERLQAPAHRFGVFGGERLLLWLAERDGALLELSAAPDALALIPGSLSAAGIVRAPAPMLGVSAESMDEDMKLRLLRPFHIPEGRIETPEQLTRALDGAVQWD